MKQIPLTRNLYALVDDENYEKLSKHKWYALRSRARFYAVRHIPKKNGKRQTLLMHRVIMNAPAGMEVDHRNHDTLNNRKQNLRICTSTENLQNKKSYRNSSSTFKGVTRHRRKWQARITFNGKLRHLGYRETEVECARLYDVAAEKLFGEFACLNFTAKTV